MRIKLMVPVLVALLLLPAAAGLAAPSRSVDDTNTASADLDAGAVAVQSSGQATATASGSSGASDSADTVTRATDPGNYTRLYVDAEHPYLRLSPGERDAFTVTVENGEDERVALDPHLYVPPVGGPVLEASWVTIDGPDSLAAGEEGEFEVSVAVPEDAEIGRYGGQIAFTDETVTYPGRPARPVHAEYVRVEVWKEPTVEIRSRTYVHAQVEAGEEVTREIVVENTGDEQVPLNPELATERRMCHGDCPGQFERSWLDVDAPSQVAPGETATVSITVSPPADADPGRYRTQVTLGLLDPNRDDRDSHWQTVDVNVEVWRQPEAPVETTFDVSERVEDVTVTLSPRSSPYRRGGAEDADPVRFDVSFVDPNGSVVDAERVRVTDRGFVDMSGDGSMASGDEAFVVRNDGQRFVYRLSEPAAGEWTLRVLPENTIGFGYEVTRNESG